MVSLAKVDYNRDSYNACLCGGCPVNRGSACIHAQEEKLAPSTDAIEKEGLMPPPEIMPGIYCAIGKSSCEDLSSRKKCLCPACPVQIETGLSKSYYCLLGSATEVG